ncbi:MAG: hypothetical protein ACI87W_001188 [Halieaceae bacterium]|jgi:uncharacterized protein (TIGR00255 family)
MKLHSMTAFARESSSGADSLTVELRSVNHRYLDCHFKLPDTLRALEPQLREALKAKLRRGKVDCQIRLQNGEGERAIAIDEPQLSAVLAALDVIRAAAPTLAAPDTLAVLQFPGVSGGRGGDEAQLQRLAMDCVHRALDNLQECRAREGAQLSEFLRQRLEEINRAVQSLRGELPELRQRQQDRLRKRLEELDTPADEGRLEQEMVFLAQKADVDEELDRLQTHVEEIERILDQGGPCGRRLDFLMQELNREANTLSAKATASSTTQSAVELKVLIEQMREQVQNIE